MSFADFFTETINGVFSDPAVLHAQDATASLASRITSEPLLVLFVIAAGLSVCAFLMALCAFFRRSNNDVGLEYLEERLLRIEAILRDQEASRSLLSKKMAGDAEFVRRELSDIRLTLERLENPTDSLKRVANG